MGSEIHLFIVWAKATEHFDSIKSQILKTALTIKDVQKVLWDKDLYAENLSRFYGENLPENSDKLNHIGAGEFFSIVVEDTNPRYEARSTTKGIQLVNINIFDLKVAFREQTGGGHRIHATNNQDESKKDIWLLLGKSIEVYLSAPNWNGTVGVYNENLLGANGWHSLAELFVSLNYLCNYVVLRNYEDILNGQSFVTHADIDLLVENYAESIVVVNAKKVFPESYRVHHSVKIAEEDIYFDFRFVGDDYYDLSFQKEILKNRIFYKDGYFVPSSEDHFYSLLHHALFHKPAVSDEYNNKLIKCASEIGMDFKGSGVEAVSLLSKFYYRNGFLVTRPRDTSVYFKYEYLRFFSEISEASLENCLSILEQVNDKSLMSSEIKSKINSRLDNFIFSPSRTNFIRPVLSKVRGRVLELGCGQGALTRFLGETGFEVVAVDVNRLNVAVAKERTKDLKSVSILFGALSDVPSDYVFDTIIVQGVSGNAEFLCSSELPYQELIKFSRDRLSDDGCFIFLDNSLLSLDKITSAQSVSSIGEEYGASPYTAKTIRKLIAKFFPTKNIDIYFPFPNHTSTTAIIKEGVLHDKEFNLSAFLLQSFFQAGGARIDSPEMLLTEFQNNDVLENFFNSYMCVVSNQKDQSDNFVFHYSLDRISSYCKVNLFRKNRTGWLVYSQYINNAFRLHNSFLLHRLEEKKTYIKGNSFALKFIQIVSKDAWCVKDVYKFFKAYIETLIKLNVFVASKVSGQYLDATPHNIIVDGDDAYLIDQEWIYHKEISIEFLIFRSFNILVASVKFWGGAYDYLPSSKFNFLQSILNFCGYSLTQSQYESFIYDEAEIQYAVTGKSKQFFIEALSGDLFLKSQRVSLSVAEAYDQLGLMQANAKVAGNEISRLFVESTDKDKTIISLQSSLSEVSDWATMLNERVSERDLQIIQLNENIEEVGAWATNLNKELVGRDSQIIHLNEKVIEVSTWANSLNEGLSTRNSQIIQLNEKLSEVSVWAQNLNANLAHRDFQIVDLSNQVNTLANELKEKEIENQNLQQSVFTLNQTNNLLSTKLSESQAVIKSIQDQIVKTELKNRELDAALVEANTNISQLTEHLDRNKVELHAAHLKIENMNTDLQKVSAWAQAIESAPFTYAFKKYGLRVARKLSRMMPVSIQAKQKIRNLLTRRPTPLPDHQAILQLEQKLNLISTNKIQSSERDICVFAVIDWHFRIQRPQHIAKGLAKTGRRVFYFSNHFHDSSEPGYQVERLDGELELYQIKLHVTGAPAIYFDPPTQAAQKMLEQSIALFYADFNVLNTVSILQHAYWYDLSKKLPNNIISYDCMDHHEGFGNVPEKLIEIEKSMLEESDFVIVTSGWLEDFAQDYNSQIVTVRNAGEYEFFSRKPQDIYRDPQNRKIIGYYGAIAEWMDVDLIRKIAKENSQYLVLMVGSDTVNAQETLSDCNNVVFIGEVPYSTLPFYLYAFDVCLLPFKVIPLTLATNPVKVYEYLSAAKPVVCVDLPEVSQFGDLVYKATDHQDFLEKINVALGKKGNTEALVQARRKFASEQTWEHRAQDISQAIKSLKLPKVSVIVLTYNNLELTKACLDSVIKFTNYPNFELIVVDNASSDDTQAYLKEFQQNHPETILCLNEKNLGFSAGNNVGLKVATGDYLLMLNNDTYVTPGWILTLLRHFKYDKSLGILGPVTTNIGNEAKIDLNYANMEQMHRVSRAYTLNNLGKHLYIPTTAFFCVMIPRDVFERVGLMDEQFGRGFFEDDDYCRRVEQLGLKAACADDVFIHHHLSASFNKLGSDIKQKLFEENKIYYESKWGVWIPHKYRNS